MEVLTSNLELDKELSDDEGRLVSHVRIMGAAPVDNLRQMGEVVSSLWVHARRMHTSVRPSVPSGRRFGATVV